MARAVLLLLCCLLSVSLKVKAGVLTEKSEDLLLHMFLHDHDHSSEPVTEDDDQRLEELLEDVVDAVKESHKKDHRDIKRLFRKFTHLETRHHSEEHSSSNMIKVFLMYLKFRDHMKRYEELEGKDMDDKVRTFEKLQMFRDLVDFCKKAWSTKQLLDRYSNHVDETLKQKYEAFKKCLLKNKCDSTSDESDDDDDDDDGDDSIQNGKGGDKDCEEEDKGPRKAVCLIQPNPGTDSKVRGTVILTQQSSDAHIKINVDLDGFQPVAKGSPAEDFLHGFHVHQYGDIVSGCGSTGGHYNPDGVNHGGPQDDVRHPGDFGNLAQTPEGNITLVFTDPMASLYGPKSIVGRALVVHAGADDLGRGGDAGSLANGNAGPRLGCCVIGIRY